MPQRIPIVSVKRKVKGVNHPQESAEEDCIV
jgi:hypothetical protein